jgi:hypothetical protein
MSNLKIRLALFSLIVISGCSSITQYFAGFSGRSTLLTATSKTFHRELMFGRDKELEYIVPEKQLSYKKEIYGSAYGNRMISIEPTDIKYLPEKEDEAEIEATIHYIHPETQDVIRVRSKESWRYSKYSGWQFSGAQALPGKSREVKSADFGKHLP